MGIHAILIVSVVCYNLLFHDIVQCNWNLSKEENVALERRLKLLNKPSVKTIVNKYGNIYDCVDFYKQPAFDHPLMKNHIFDFQLKSPALYNKTSEQDPSSLYESLFEESVLETCPIGSVPIRRITNDDLIRQRHALEIRRVNPTNRLGTYLAVARTKAGQVKYIGAEGQLSIHNPNVHGRQFSTTRLKLQNGPNSIEAGWRVDPTLNGDNKTRFFVRTDAGKSHCFNTRCPGFVHTNRKFPLDGHFSDSISKPGGPTYKLRVRIIRDNKSGNWNLFIGSYYVHIGFWPSRIFSTLKEFANYIEWGGAAYSPPGSPLSPMGSGNLPIRNILYDGYIDQLKITNERSETIDAVYEIYTDDSSLYSVFKAGKFDPEWGVLMMYGGPGHH